MSAGKKTLEQYRAEAVKKAEAKKAAEEALELEAFELEEKFESQGLKRGVDFEILTATVGNFVVKKPDYVVAKQFNALDSKQRDDEAVMRFVAPCVAFPESDKFRATVQAHGGIAWRCTAVALKLYEGAKFEAEGK